MKAFEQANGIAYVHRGEVILFPYGLAPEVLFGDRWVNVTAPERFGDWDSRADRRAWVRNFVEGEA